MLHSVSELPCKEATVVLAALGVLLRHARDASVEAIAEEGQVICPGELLGHLGHLVRAAGI